MLPGQSPGVFGQGFAIRHTMGPIRIVHNTPLLQDKMYFVHRAEQVKP